MVGSEELQGLFFLFFLNGMMILMNRVTISLGRLGVLGYMMSSFFFFFG